MTTPERISTPDIGAIIAGRLRAWAAGEPQGPAVMELFPSARCNLNCIFCRRTDHYAAFLENCSEVPDDRYRRLITEGIELGVKEVSFKGGGEPLVRRELVEFAAPLFARAGVRGLLITNGTLLDAGLASLLADCGWTEVAISLDAPDAAAHDHIRQKPGTFEAATSAARLLSAAKARAGRGPSVKFHAVLTKLSAARTADMVRLAADCGAQSFELDSLDLSEPSAAELKLSGKDSELFAAGLEDAIALAEKLKISANLASFRRREYSDREAARASGGPACLYPWFQLSVQADGSLVPCCVAGMRRDGGRIHAVTLREAWFGSPMEEIREAFRRGARPAFCANCSPLQFEFNSALAGLLPAGKEQP
jgi:MoaA/NifB/PqqE/SkfB family radical SAM enzyme